MRVKRLEVQGFKSFKDKTVIHFDHSITGIVGPNGCGKSNIVDAFFWVMGEQSHKHIRANGSEDLIFNGSSRYSPLGLAEATLVLETDFVDTENAPAGASAKDLPLHLRTKEIAVTRRVYRTGEGEYFINGVQARLKDIHELFMDTGVGAKGYSIIEQGQIGKIVNAKPEDRRVLIEEAAGIAKYKARKKESLRKMEAAQANLARLNDVVTELERSVNSLERQAQKASQYKKYKEELLDKEMTWGRRKNRVLRARLDDLRGRRETLELDLTSLRAELSTEELSSETDRIEQLTLSKMTEELGARITEKSANLTRAQAALDLSRRRQSDLSTQLEALTAEKADLETAIAGEREKISGLTSENENAAEEFEASAARVSDLDDEVRIARAQTEDARRSLESAKRDLMSGIAKASDLNSRIAALESKIESTQAQVERLAVQASSLGEKTEIAVAESDRVNEEAEIAREKKTSLQSESRSAASALDAKEQELRAKRRQSEEANRLLLKQKAKLQSLEELAASLEGYSDGPRSVLDWAKENGKESALRTLAEGLDIQAGFESALEGFLEGKLEALVSEDVDTAIQALRALGTHSQGRAGILVSSAAPEKPSHSAVQTLKEHGFTVLGPLSDFIQTNDKLAKNTAASVLAVLSQAIVVEDLSPLASFLKSNSLSLLGGVSIVARDGSAIDRDGILRGGAVSNDRSASLLGRKKSIEDLTVEVTTLEATYAQIEEEMQALSEANELDKGRLASIRMDLQAAEIESAKIERDVESANRQRRDLEGQASTIDGELDRLKSDASRAATEKEESSAEMTAIAENRSTLEEKILSGEDRYAELEVAFREQEAALQLLRIQEAGLKERAHSVRRELEAGLGLIRDRERRLNDVTRQLDRAQSENEEHTGGDEDFITKIEDLTRELSEQREEFSMLRDRLEVISEKVGGSLSRIKELHSEGDSKTHAANQFALDIERLTADLSHLIQNLEEKYGPGCIDAVALSPIQEEMNDPVVTLEMSSEEEQILSEEVERLRERIRRLGDVNPTAVEEYDEKKKRFDYLNTEKSDLLKSIEDLNEAIEHINKTSEERFQKAFEAIRDRFERLFPIIFGGGQAKLSLVYPEGSEDILEAGIDILAQPPGKKVVNIGLLSGGEKALTAVSLIFAIFMVKPSPFCILDEVDAPLDDANIGKFNALLREMSSKSQFIIITHNKKTMELNDTLYGVTMEEPGVSKMVSIEMH